MKYVVFEAAGSQVRAQEGEEIELGKVGKSGEEVIFDKVLLLVDEAKVTIGQPYLKDVSVVARVLGEFKGDKIRVATYKAKSRYRRVKGFRSLLNRVKIEKIVVKSSSVKKETPVKKTAKTTKKA